MPASSGESDDDDENAGLQAQVAQMLGPVQARAKKAHKKICLLYTSPSPRDS